MKEGHCARDDACCIRISLYQFIIRRFNHVVIYGGFEGDIIILLDRYMICMLNQWMIIMSIYRCCFIGDARRVNQHITGLNY